MPKQETSLHALNHFLPAHTFTYIISFFKKHSIHLTLTHERKTVLGDYRIPTKEMPQHRISVNANLNQYNFLITLLHELAHLEAFVKYGLKHAPHGKEWKDEFRKILKPVIRDEIFPKDIAAALQDYLDNPSASTCTDPKLYKALYRYSPRKRNHRLVDELEINQVFETENGRKFIKLEELRTRSRCKDLKTGRMYFFQGIVEVKLSERD